MIPALAASRRFLPFAAGDALSYLFRTINGPISGHLIAEFDRPPDNGRVVPLRRGRA